MSSKYYPDFISIYGYVVSGFNSMAPPSCHLKPLKYLNDTNHLNEPSDPNHLNHPNDPLL
jgi:hypothetical protein